MPSPCRRRRAPPRCCCCGQPPSLQPCPSCSRPCPREPPLAARSSPRHRRWSCAGLRPTHRRCHARTPSGIGRCPSTSTATGTPRTTGGTSPRPCDRARRPSTLRPSSRRHTPTSPTRSSIRATGSVQFASSSSATTTISKTCCSWQNAPRRPIPTASSCWSRPRRTTAIRRSLRRTWRSIPAAIRYSAWNRKATGSTPSRPENGWTARHACSFVATGDNDRGAERYTLLQLHDTLWAHRLSGAGGGKLWSAGESGFLGYRGARWGRRGGVLGDWMAQSQYRGGVRPPWGLKAAPGARGDWFFDPALVETTRHPQALNADGPASQDYVFNPYLDDLTASCSGAACPAPPPAPVGSMWLFGTLGAAFVGVGLVSSRLRRRGSRTPQ